MLSLPLLALLAASPALKIAATPFKTVDLPAARGELYSEHLAARLLEKGVVVSTPRDVASILGLERERRLLGCAEGSDCLLELAGALGVDAVLSGEVARLDRGFQVVVKVINSTDAAVRFARSAQVDDEQALFAALDAWAGLIAGEPVARSLAPVVPMAVGAATVAVGVGFLVSAGAAWSGLNARGADTLTLAQASTARAWGQQSQTLGLALAGAGAAVAAAGLIWWVASTPRERAASVWLVPTGPGVAVAGRW